MRRVFSGGRRGAPSDVEPCSRLGAVLGRHHHSREEGRCLGAAWQGTGGCVSQRAETNPKHRPAVLATRTDHQWVLRMEARHVQLAMGSRRRKPNATRAHARRA